MENGRFFNPQLRSRRVIVMSAKVDKAARDLIEQHGIRAAYLAVERLNESIDRRDQNGRDFWAQVAHAIHESQRMVKEHKARSGRSPKTVASR
jgi:hypothetical protein